MGGAGSKKKIIPERPSSFRRLLDKNRENPEGYQLLGEALYQKEEYQEALGAYEESMKRVSGDAFLYNNIAYAQLAWGI